jgi:hypothetical protein
MLGVISLTLMLAAPPQAAAPDPMVDALARCLPLTDDAARLRCLETSARALVDATSRRDVVVVKRSDIQRTRRSLFGFGGDPAELLGATTPAERIETLETRLVSAAPIGNDRWTVRLEEGGLWQTNEPWVLGSDPRGGVAAVVRRGALGSFTLKIPGARAVRVRRVN